MRDTPDEWFLKKKNNTLYGPVSLAEMAQWARQCRIVAGNLASTNQQDWIAVEDIPELAMEWLALRQDGKRYGPFPLSAVPELRKHQVLPEDAILTHATSGKTLSMPEALATLAETGQAKPERQPTDPPPGPATQRSQTEKPQRPADGSDHEDDASDDRLPASPATNHQEIEVLQARLDELLQQQEQTEARAQARIQSLRDEVDQARDALDTCKREAQARLQQSQEKLQALQTQCAELQDTLEQARSRSERLQARAEQHDATLTELRQQVAFMKKNTAALNAQLGAVRATASQRARLLALAWIFVTASVAALIVVLLGHGCRRTPAPEFPRPPEQEATPASSDTLPPVPQSDTPTGQPPPRSAGTETLAPFPRIQAPGISISRQTPDALHLRFDESIFSSLDTLAPEGRQWLDNLARQIPRNLTGWRLTLHGHTDNIPLRNTSRFADNSALALARAEAAAAYLIRRAGFPADAISTLAGDAAPFPNDTPENRQRNRTVTIILQRRNNGSPPAGSP